MGMTLCARRSSSGDGDGDGARIRDTSRGWTPQLRLAVSTAAGWRYQLPWLEVGDGDGVGVRRSHERTSWQGVGDGALEGGIEGGEGDGCGVGGKFNSNQFNVRSKRETFQPCQKLAICNPTKLPE